MLFGKAFTRLPLLQMASSVDTSVDTIELIYGTAPRPHRNREHAFTFTGNEAMRYSRNYYKAGNTNVMITSPKRWN